MRTFGLGLAALTLVSCGYVGDPLAPSLNIPPPVQDLRVEERGNQILIRFTLPGAATDGVPFRSLAAVELRAGDREFAVPTLQPGAVEVAEPASRWIGQSLEFRVRAQGPTGRWSEWSSSVLIQVIAPLAPPSNTAAVGTAEGVRVSWESPAASFRVYRVNPGSDLMNAGETDERLLLDRSAAFGATYTYRLQAFEGNTTSELSEPVSVSYEDHFPPSAPTAFQAVAGLASIELSWQPPPEADLAGFFVYRAGPDGVFSRLNGQVAAPSLSDAMVEPGTAYRYTITAVDALGNESPRSAEVVVVAP